MSDSRPAEECLRFQDDPDAPGCCIGCGEPREAHLASKQQAYPAWYDEPCPHCKNGRLKGECDVTLRQEIERLRGELEVTRQCLFQAQEAAKLLASETPGFTKRLRDARLTWAKSCPCTCEACDDLYEEIKDICASEKSTQSLPAVVHVGRECSPKRGGIQIA